MRVLGVPPVQDVNIENGIHDDSSTVGERCLAGMHVLGTEDKTEPVRAHAVADTDERLNENLAANHRQRNEARRHRLQHHAVLVRVVENVGVGHQQVRPACNDTDTLARRQRTAGAAAYSTFKLEVEVPVRVDLLKPGDGAAGALEAVGVVLERHLATEAVLERWVCVVDCAYHPAAQAMYPRNTTRLQRRWKIN